MRKKKLEGEKIIAQKSSNVDNDSLLVVSEKYTYFKTVNGI